MKQLVERIPYFLRKSNEFFGYPRREVLPSKYRFRYERLIMYKTMMDEHIHEHKRKGGVSYGD